MKPRLPFLETMITQSCNLSCVGCTNHSDIRHSGYVRWEDGKSQLERWLNVIEVGAFGIMGGEPLINPQISDWLIGVRRLMPSCQIYLFTNGTLLHRHMHIIELAQELGNITFRISIHLKGNKLNDNIETILSKFKRERFNEDGDVYVNGGARGHVFRWVANGVELHIKYPTIFIKSHKYNYQNMTPFDSNPNEAFSFCVQQTCPLLYNGNIFKCSTSALLISTLKKFNNPNFDRWKKYIDYGIAPNDNPDKISHFVNNFGRPHSMCGQCPTRRDEDAIIRHDNTTVRRKK